MPQYTARIFVCLAVFALAFATGAEAVVCGANQYLKMDGLYAGTVKNGPKCVACPTGMSNPAGVAGGYGDSANPNLAVILASKVAATAANSDLLTWCDVDAGYFLTTDSSATIPGVATICPNTRIAGSRITTSIKQSIIGITTDAASDLKGDVACTVKSTCAAGKYLKTTVSGGASTAGCFACPTGMSSAAGSTLPVFAGGKTELAHTTGRTAAVLFTYCDVDAGYFLTTDSSAIIPGVATICPNTRIAGSRITTSIKQTIIGITTDAAADVKGDVACTVKSTCAAGKYLKTTAASGVSTAGCFACPAGMSSAAGSTLSTFAGGKVELAYTTGRTAVKMFTYCDVDAGSFLTTDSSAIIPGVATSCPITRIAGSGVTTSIKQSITGVTTDAASDLKGDVACTVKSTCAAGQYLKTTVSGGASTAGCFACPTGMSSAAGSTLPVFAGGKAELAHTTGRTAAVLYTFCDVDTGYYQTTASSAITPGAVTACSSTSTRSLGRSIQAHATGTVQAENVVCVVEKITSGPAGPAGPAGTAGTASPAAPLSTITAAVFGAVVPAILILV